jgi:DNA (cytosine-5)-methyltransferase 1
VATRPIHGLAICSGGGGLELGVRLAVGPRYRPVAHIERDPFAAAVLVARMEDQVLGQALVWADLCTFDGRPWRGRVDLVTAGFPCQPWSAAGRRQGTADDRWLWPDVARIVADVGPRLVLLENVPGLLAGGLGPVLGDLADLGFDAEWDVFSAADVGAPHLRKRVFVLAWLADSDRRGQPQFGREPADDRNARHDTHRPGGPHVANSDSGRRGPEHRPAHPQPPERRQSRHDGDLWPPRPDDRDGWDRAGRTGLPQPSVRRMADGLAHRLDRLHCIGNGVVPDVAAVALLALAERAGLSLSDGGDL